jgi:peptide/nickel transport system ATP-binding protein
MNDQPVIQAENVNIEYQLGKQWLNVICDVSLTINPLEIHGLVGESGSGKSTLGLALMRYLADNARFASGQIHFGGDDLIPKSEAEMRHIWGSQINLVPQDPLSSLNPSYTVGDQIAEITRLHRGLSHNDSRQQAVEMLERVRIADPDDVARRYPHQLSGGMQQRVMIAMALSTQPRLLILDEPTTALDVTTQAVILDLFRELILKHEAAALFVSHDLGIVAQLCDRVTVLYGGEVMESAPVVTLFEQPLHPYTAGLLASLPHPTEGSETRLSTIEGVAPSLAERPDGCVFASRCPVALDKCFSEKPTLENAPEGRSIRCHRWTEIASGEIIPHSAPQGMTPSAPPRQKLALDVRAMNKRFGQVSLLDRLSGRDPGTIQAVDQAALTINARSTLGLVGESGSGKTTLARCIVALEAADSGEIELCEVPISKQLSDRTKETFRELQMVFQNPHDTLNPYHTVGQALGRTLQRLSEKTVSREQIETRVVELLEAVRLTGEYAKRFPHELSGGEKQRVAIARAFATNPALVVADEPTSSLDVSVQAVILNLLKDLRAQEDASYLLISHDLEVIAYLADWIAVMYLGQIIEEGTADQVSQLPSHPYTEALLSAIPIADPTVKQGRIRLDGDLPSARNMPSGCRFHTRCPRKIGDICEQDEPPWRDAGDNHSIRCHIPIEELIEAQNQPARQVAEGES